MKKTFILFVTVMLLFTSVPAFSQLDLEQEVLVIPDTHNEKPYIWHVAKNPRGYELILAENRGKAGEVQTYSLRIVSPSGIRPDDVHVFITDDDLHTYAHRKAERTGDEYHFTYRPPRPGKYRIEVVFENSKMWINLRTDVKLTGSTSAEGEGKAPGDEDYQVKIKLIPKKAYAEHVVTFLYEIHYKGVPLKDIEKLDGFDMHVAAWDEDLKEFVYATPRQNLGGPEVAISVVFMRAGRHAIFGEFMHQGVVRRIDSVIFVHEEPRHDSGAIENLRPAD